MDSLFIWRLTMDGIAKLLSTDGFIQVNKALIKKFGLHEAVMLGELCAEYVYWQNANKLVDDEWFFSTRQNIEENTGLSEHFQRKALATLTAANIIEIKKKGVPATNYYRIDYDQLLMALTSSCQRREPLDVDGVDLNNNKQTKINNKPNNSKELLQNPPSEHEHFTFGKSKDKKPNLYSKCISLIDDYTTDRNLREVLIEYLKIRIEMKDKPLYLGVWKGLLNKLDREFDAGERVAVVRQSIERGYASFFPVNSSFSRNFINNNGTVHVPVMTEEDYAEEAKMMAELEAKGVRTKF